jgi:hypothetical protein
VVAGDRDDLRFVEQLDGAIEITAPVGDVSRADDPLRARRA